MRPSVVASGAALAMAAGAAIALAVADAIWFGTPTADGPALMLLYVVGWVLLVWAALAGIGVAVHLFRSAAHRRPRPIEIVLVGAIAAIVVGVLLAHPLIGSGQGFG